MGNIWSTLSKKVIDNFNNPKNVGEIKNPDGIGHVGDPAWGIDLELYIRVENSTIIDTKFKAFGCTVTIATNSMISEMLKGKSIEQALNISDQEIAEALDGLPPPKMHCAELGRELIKSAIDDFLKRQSLLRSSKSG